MSEFKGLDGLLIEIFNIKEQKNFVVRSQQYEKAAMLRDSERTLERKIFAILYGDEDYDTKKYEVAINKYLKDKYDIDYDYKDYGSVRQIIREFKLKDLGI